MVEANRPEELATAADTGPTQTCSYGSVCGLAGVYGEKGVRKQMEDLHILCKSTKLIAPQLPACLNIGVFGILDGHGGRQTAAFIRDNLPAELAKALETIDEQNQAELFMLDDALTRKVINSVFSKLDSRIAIELPSCKDGCTAIILLMGPSNVGIVASLGDSGACLGRTIDSCLHAIPLSDSHKPWVIKEKDRILKAGGTIEGGRVNGALEITRSFGDIPLKKYGVLCTPTLRKFTVEPSQDVFVVMGCDGFWNCWPGSEIVTKANELLQKEKRRLAVESVDSRAIDVKHICKQMVEYVIVDKKSQDNVSVLMFVFQQ
eukprot:GHVS01091179.1.p1 GENE.GHVS01091179.1~~GHVS01091179.1.p1  ORF type:complete len:343 (-),score=54.32 GHVS01091179.1:72-1028(-)